MDEKRPSRNPKKRDTYSPSRYDTPQRQPRKPAYAVKKADESSSSAPLTLPASTSTVDKSLLASTSSSGSSNVLSSTKSSGNKNEKSTPAVTKPSKSTTSSENSTMLPSTSSGGKRSGKLPSIISQPSTSRGPRKSLLKLPSLPQKEDTVVETKDTPSSNAKPVKALPQPSPKPVFVVPTTSSLPIPFDYGSAALSNLPDRRNKSKSVKEMGLLPRTRNRRSHPSTGEDTVDVKEKQSLGIDEGSNTPASSSTPLLTPSSKTGAKRGRKPNPNALIPASSPKDTAIKEKVVKAKPRDSPLASGVPSTQEPTSIGSPSKPIPFDYNNPTANELSGHRNKSKSVKEMGLLPRTRNRRSQPSTTGEETVDVKEKQSLGIEEGSNSMPASASTPLLTPSSKTGAKRGRKPNALIPASSPKDTAIKEKVVKAEPCDSLFDTDVPSTQEPTSIGSPSKPIPFDYNNPTANEMLGRRNKSKSVYEMGLLPRTASVIRTSAKDKGNQPLSTFEEKILFPEASVNVKEKQSVGTGGESKTSSSDQFSTPPQKTGAKSTRKSNPNALIPASSNKSARLSLSKSLLPPSAESSNMTSPASEEPSSVSSKLSPKEPAKSALFQESSLPETPTTASVADDKVVEVNAEPSVIPLAIADVPPPSQEPIFVVPALPPPRPVPFDYNNPTANELPERRNKSKSVFEIAPLLAKKDIVRRPRKPFIKKVSVSEAGNSYSLLPENAMGGDGAAATEDGIAEAENVQAAASSSPASETDKKKKRKRKRPHRLTMKKKKASLPAEHYEDQSEEVNDGYEQLEGDDEATEAEVIVECELENYGESATKFLSNLHPDIEAAFKHYEETDESFFTRFVLYANATEEETASEAMVVDKTEYPPFLAVFLNGATGIIDLATKALSQPGADDVFPNERFSFEKTIDIMTTQFNRENAASILIYGLTEIHKVVVETLTQKLPLPQMYIKCRDIANLIAQLFVAYPTELIFLFHRFFLSHMDADALIVYMILCRFVNQVFKVSNVLKEFTAQYLDEINTIFVDIIKQHVADPYRQMVYKIDRKFLSKDIVVAALVCHDVSKDQYLEYQKSMLWFNTGFRKMGATVESLTLSANWTDPELLEISAYNAIAMVQSYLKFITSSYPSSKIIVVNYGDPSLFFYNAIHYVDRISGVINIAFPTSTVIDEVEHVRGGVEDTILNMTYCPSLFVIGEKAEHSDISHFEQILKHYKTEQAGLVIVGDADDALTISSKTLLHYGITPACIKRILLEHFADFIEKCVSQPVQPKIYFPSQGHENDPDFEVYTVTKEEVITRHMELFEQTKNYYDIRVDLGRKRNNDKSRRKVSANGLTKEAVDAETPSSKEDSAIEKFSRELINLNVA